MEMGGAVTGHTGPVGVVSVEDGVVIGAEAFEESCFSGGVGGHVAVIVEVILSEVGEDGDVWVEVVGALLVEGVRGGFVDAGFAGGVADAGEEAREVDGAGGGEGGGFAVADEVVVDGAEQAGGDASGLEEVLEENDGGGLAVGAGDSGEGEGLGGVVEEAFGELSAESLVDFFGQEQRDRFSDVGLIIGRGEDGGG